MGLRSLAVGLLLAGFGFLAFPASAQTLSAEAIVAAAGLSDADVNKVLAGEVVAADLPETTDTMLAQAITVLIPAPPSKLIEAAMAGQAYKENKDTLGFGPIDLANIEQSLAEAKYTDAEADEVKKLAKAKPGSDFNLSKQEFAAIQAAVAAGASSPQALSTAYQKILAARVKAYAQGGLSAIAPYDRGGSEISPAADLKAAAQASKLVQKVLPDFYKAYLNYPKDKMDGVKESFLWVKQMVDKRPTFALEHRMLYTDEKAAVLLVRQFYVGQSYDAMQVTAGAFPTDKGSLVLYGNRTMTDQVAGFMSGTRHSVGRGMMRDQLIEHFKALRAQYAK